MANSIRLLSKDETIVKTPSGNKSYYCLGLGLYTSTSGGNIVPAKFLQTDECSSKMVGVTPFGGIILNTVNTQGSDSIKLTAQPLDGTAATSVTLTVTKLIGTAVGSAVTAS